MYVLYVETLIRYVFHFFSPVEESILYLVFIVIRCTRFVAQCSLCPSALHFGNDKTRSLQPAKNRCGQVYIEENEQ